jgi:hypothetical protein
MLKLLFWGLIGYILYRYFQMKKEIKEGHQRDFMQHPHHDGTQQQEPSKSGVSKNDGEFIDYEEIKRP